MVARVAFARRSNEKGASNAAIYDHALPLSSVLMGSGGRASTASIDNIGASFPSNFGDALLQVPIIVLLVLGAALLIAVYFWLSNTERRYLEN